MSEHNPTHSVPPPIPQGQEGKGEEAKAWNNLWKQYAPRLLRLAESKLRSSAATADAEDLVLSAFKSFFRGVQSNRFELKGKENDLWNLLAKIVSNKAFDLTRKKPKRQGGGHTTTNEADLHWPSDDTSTPGLAEVLSPEPTPDLVVEIAELWRHLLERLTPRQRQIALLKVEDLTVEQIAGQLGCSLRTVERELGHIRAAWLKEVGE
jgi:RNA polymerase sigma factor (sigma-70 family)